MGFCRHTNTGPLGRWGAVTRPMRARISPNLLLFLAFVAMGLGVIFELLRAATGLGGPALNSLTENWVYMTVEFVAIGVCVARVAKCREHRRAWGLMALALGCWSLGDLLWAVWLDQLSEPPFPSAADVSYLLMYPVMYGALMLLIRSRLRQAAASQWLDGGVLALAVGAVAAALVFSDVLAMTHGRFVAEAVTVAYPVGDFILLMFVAVAYTLADWRPGRDWLVLGAGVILMAVGDIMNVDQVAGGIYVDSTLLNAIYLTSFSLLASAAWVPSHWVAADTREAPHTILLTLAAATIALILLVVAAFMPITPLAVALAAGSLVLAALRSALTYLENVRILRARSREAVTDSLTSLGNRRQLMSDLERALDASSDQRSWTLAFFDLNGFKRYNDTFGHLAGDALLTRLASSLRTVVADHGRVYRPGGDEFCVLLHGRYPRHDRLIAGATSALTERGRGFDVTTAIGVAVMPDEADTANGALRLADERMYADKGRAHRSQTRDVLMQLLDERTPGLLDHVSGVTSLTAAVAAQMDLNAEQLDETLRAAELHDIGKLAIPDEILNKPGPLDLTELEFMKQHPIIGQRILSAAPALAPVAALVRASHERWDGGGYPDGLAGDDIPLGARIIAACDAYDAMTSKRCYQRARSQADALAELRRNAGTQFDPAVIDAIERQFLAGTDSRTPALPAAPERRYP
jgi:two-component system cell cycle response regulator